MSLSINVRLAILTLVIGVAALIIGWAAFSSWEEVGELQRRFSTAHLRSFQVADHLQSTILKLNNRLINFELRGDTNDLARFQRESEELNVWIDAQKPSSSEPERELLNKIDQEYDVYLATATNTVEAIRHSRDNTVRLTGIANMITEAIQLLDLGYKLEDAHREVLEGFLTQSQKSVSLLQRVIFGSLFVLLALAIWLSVIVYREMIGPLRMQLVESQTIIERQEKLASLGVLAAGVAHEIRNPLTAIKARLFTQQKLLKPESPELEDAVVIGREINRLERIVKDVLEFARPADPTFATVPAATALREVQQLMAPQLERNGIELKLDSLVDANIQADPQQLKQVLINLVQNAAESIGHNGRIVLGSRTSMERLHGQSQPVVILEVADTGKGIPAEVQKRLFDPFFSTKEMGTGLGLAIAARIVEKHGGALEFQTQLNHGTTFGIVLPQAK
jgi:signal transduction histidine kinase